VDVDTYNKNFFIIIIIENNHKDFHKSTSSPQEKEWHWESKYTVIFTSHQQEHIVTVAKKSLKYKITNYNQVFQMKSTVAA